MTTLFVFGTRPEAIKLCPVVRHLASLPDQFDARVCVTAQHRGMLDQVLTAFEVHPHHDLDMMRAGQTLGGLTGRIMSALEPILQQEKPDVVLVQGDTTTTLCGALAAFYARVPIAHVEAGLRTGDMTQPFPEEMNRVLTSRMASLHLAATRKSEQNLLGEGVPQNRIVVTGQSGIDAVLFIRNRLERGDLPGLAWPQLKDWLRSGKKLIVVTAHRRESFGPGFENICHGIARIASRPDVQIVYPVHRNPHVMEPVFRILGKCDNVLLTDPLDYVGFVDLMRHADLLITDSGGVQEEGPSLGKPILVLRDKTERPEAVEAGTVILVGTNAERIFQEATRLLDDANIRLRMSAVHNPYGDGFASPRIATALRSFLNT